MEKICICVQYMKSVYIVQVIEYFFLKYIRFVQCNWYSDFFAHSPVSSAHLSWYNNYFSLYKTQPSNANHFFISAKN